MSLIVVGGGATGLASAYIAAKRGEHVTLVEASDRLGGLLSTFDVGGTKLECFYHHFFTHDQEIQDLLTELNLIDDVKYEETKMGMYRYGEIHPFTVAKDLLKFPKLNLVDKLRFGLTSLFLSNQKDWKKYEDTSILAWFYKWAGKPATDAIWLPMLKIKFGRHAGETPVSWMIGRMSQRVKSRSKGKEKLGYLQGSLQRLVDSLESSLREMNVNIVKNTAVESLIMDGHRTIGIHTKQGDFLADQILMTVPVPSLVKLIPSGYEFYRNELERIKYFGAICGVVVTQKPLSDTYWINVADADFLFGGVIEQTNFIPPSEYQGKHITYLSRYVTLDDPMLNQSDSEIANMFISQLSLIFPDLETRGIEEIKIFRTRTAAPICDLNFSEKIPTYQTPIANLYIANMVHVYPDERSVNNSIKVALEVDSVLKSKVKTVF
jgi:protoporphyrinogen oxidase